MSRTHTWHSAVAGAVVSAVALATVQVAAMPAANATTTDRPAATAAPSAVSTLESQTARAVATSLVDRDWSSQVQAATLTSAQVNLHALTTAATAPAGEHLRKAVANADRGIAAAKGLGSDTGPLLRIRLGDTSMRDALEAGATPLVAAAPNDDTAETITAWNVRGQAVTLDAATVPDQPVYIVDVDVSKALSAGLKVLDQQLAEQGISSPAQTVNTATAGWWATKITSIRVSDDEEPWVKGDAEMFSLVSGFGLDGKVRVDTVDMPYLDNDGTTYYPNQILVNWSNYKYNLADAVLMEDDGDTNYLALAKALASALLTITDQGTYVPLVNALLDAMPTSWWTDDPDYVDSWYTLAKDGSGLLNGARGNGWMTVEPYFVQQF